MKLINMKDIARMGHNCSDMKYGFTIYRGVLVVWDEDYDYRIIEVLDRMPANVLDRMLAVQEHEGGISFVWDGVAPDGYGESSPSEDDPMARKGVDVPGGDFWCIQSSISLSHVNDLFLKSAR